MVTQQNGASPEGLIEEQGNDEVEIQVVDDTPPEDQQRDPLPYDALGEDKSNKDDQLTETEFSHRARELKHAVHDERRAREAAQRELEELRKYAVAQQAQLDAIQKRYHEGEKMFVEHLKNSTGSELAHAQHAVQAAYEAGDAAALAKAQAELASVAARQVQVQGYVPQPLPAPAPVPQAQPAPVQPTDRDIAWKERNSWFQKNPEMTDVAYAFHAALVRQGVPAGSDAYYSAIDTRMRKTFPEFPWEGGNVNQQVQQPKQQTQVPVASGRTPGAAAAGNRGKQTIQLTASQMRMCKSLGITPQQYVASLRDPDVQQQLKDWGDR